MIYPYPIRILFGWNHTVRIWKLSNLLNLVGLLIREIQPHNTIQQIMIQQIMTI